MPVPVATSTIVSQAFRLMKLSPISSFGDDSEQASAAAEQYAVALDILLEGCDWSFASTYADLSPVSVLPSGITADPRLPYVYRLPGDCVVLREVVDNSVRWRRDDDLLRADLAPPLSIRYTRRIDDENRTSANFRTAVAYQLAALLAPRWIETAAHADRLDAGIEKFRARAMAVDRFGASAERYDGGPDQPDWVAEALA